MVWRGCPRSRCRPPARHGRNGAAACAPRRPAHRAARRSRPLQADDAVEPVGIEIERLAAGLRMGAHQGMLDVGRLGDLLRRARRGPVCGRAACRSRGWRAGRRCAAGAPRATPRRPSACCRTRSRRRGSGFRCHAAASPWRGRRSRIVGVPVSARIAVLSVVPSAISVDTMTDTSGTSPAALVAQQTGYAACRRPWRRRASVAAPCARREPRQEGAQPRPVEQRGRRGLAGAAAIESLDARPERPLAGNDVSMPQNLARRGAKDHFAHPEPQALDHRLGPLPSRQGAHEGVEPIAPVEQPGLGPRRYHAIFTNVGRKT